MIENGEDGIGKEDQPLEAVRRVVAAAFGTLRLAHAAAAPLLPGRRSFRALPDLVTTRPSKRLISRILVVRHAPLRQASVERNTKETRIRATVSLDGTGRYDVKTGIGFLDHMIEQLSRHSLIDMTLAAEGDLHIDDHHTTEDCGIVIGQALAEALGNRQGIRRYGDALLPMDEALTRVALDLSNRPYLVWQVKFDRPKLGTMDTELFKEFFQALAQHAGMTLHIESLYGENNHHIVETCFKGVARALRQAIEIDPRQADAIPSTKGAL